MALSCQRRLVRSSGDRKDGRHVRMVLAQDSGAIVCIRSVLGGNLHAAIASESRLGKACLRACLSSSPWPDHGPEWGGVDAGSLRGVGGLRYRVHTLNYLRALVANHTAHLDSLGCRTWNGKLCCMRLSLQRGRHMNRVGTHSTNTSLLASTVTPANVENVLIWSGGAVGGQTNM